jgi:branched-chain amino acid transport system ATP-binding protein
MRRFWDQLRPSVATGGLPILPLLVLASLNGADELDRLAFGVLVPEIRDWFGIGLGTAILMGQLSTLFLVVVAIPTGFMADRFNRVRLTAAGAALWATFTLLTGLAPGILLLGLFRFGSGVAKALAPAQVSLLADYYPPSPSPAPPPPPGPLAWSAPTSASRASTPSPPRAT